MNRVLYKNIIATITYYDVLDYPLTSFEIWKHLIRHSGDDSGDIWSLSDVMRALGSDEVRQYVSEKNGMYFLFGRENLVTIRRKRECISFSKMRRLRRIVSVLRISPFVRMICVTGRLAYYNCDEKSDLDVLVVYKSGHIWTGRSFLTILTHIMGVRRYGNKTNNRICLNYHITTDSLCVPTKDLFAAHEYTFIIPIFDSGYFTEFCRKNMWIGHVKPHYKCARIDHALTIYDNIFTKYIRAFFEMVLSDKGMEKRLAKLQRKKIKSNPKTSEKGALIIYNNEHLVFLPKPHGPVVFDEYKRRLEALEIHF